MAAITSARRLGREVGATGSGERVQGGKGYNQGFIAAAAGRECTFTAHKRLTVPFTTLPHALHVQH